MSTISSVEDLESEDNCRNLCYDILEKYKKGRWESSENVEKLAPNRLTHVVSCYIMGNWLYNKFFKKRFNTTFFSSIYMKNDVNSKIHKFNFLWALTCLYHDAGYVYEEGDRCTLADFSILNEKDRPEDLPSVYNLANIYLYEQLRRENCMKLDHGIYGALKLRKDFNELLKEEHPIDQTPPKAYNCAVWSIMCHNIWFQKPKNYCASCYKAKDLHALILNHAKQKVKISNSPFFYLLCLADNLEPSKKIKDSSDWKKIVFSYNSNQSTIQITYSKEQNKDPSGITEYIKSVKSLNDWLVNVESIKNNGATILELHIELNENENKNKKEDKS